MVDIDKLVCDFLNPGELLGEDGIKRIEDEIRKSQHLDYTYSLIQEALTASLKRQGLEYKEGAIKPIESMTEFKEGDILYNKDSYASDSIFIFKGMADKTNAYLCYVRLYDSKDFSVYSKKDWDEGVGIYGGEFYSANHKQKELLFSKMEESGYKWNPDTLTLEKIEKPTLSSIFKGEWYICIKPVNYFTVGKIYYAIKDWVLRSDLCDTVDVRWTPDCFLHATKEDIEKQITRLNPSTIEMLEKPSTIKFNEPDIEGMVEEYSDSLSIVPSITKDEKLYYYRQGLEDMYRKLKGNKDE